MKKLLLFSLLSVISIYPQELKKVADGFKFCEGPAWDGNGSLFVSSCYEGKIFKITDEQKTVFIDSGETALKQTNGLTFGKDGWLYGCDYGLGAIIRISPEKKVEVICPGYQGKKFNRPNDLAFHPNGDIYFSEPKSDKPDGRLFRINMTNKEPELIMDSLCYPNGLVFSKDARTLYLSESAQNRVLKLRLDKNGNILSREVFVDLPGGEPDGLALDVQGNLYVPHFGGGMIYVINPEGKVIENIKMPGAESSNVEFGGKDMKTLYMTEDETNSVYMMERKIPGMKLIR